MSKQKRDVWCDHCDYRYAAKIDGGEGVAICPNCGKPTLLVTCGVCENQSELSHVNFAKSNWICPQCKEYREVSAETITDFLAAQISIEPTEKVRRSWQRPSFRIGCIGLILLYILANILLSSCGDLLSTDRPVIVQEIVVTRIVERRVTRVVEKTVTPTVAEIAVTETPIPNLNFQEVDQSNIDLASFTEMAYIAEDDTTQPKIYRYDLQSRTRQKVTMQTGCTGQIHAIQWAADGQGQTILCEYQNAMRLYAISAMTENEAELIAHGDYDTFSFSPDGTKLAYTSAGERGLFIRSLVGGESSDLVVKLLSDSLSWSPDSEQIVFVGGYSRLDNLYIHTLSDTSVQNITQNDTRIEQYPTWSPNGDAIVFYANYDGSWNLHRYDVGTGEIVQISEMKRSANLRDLTWTPDGKYVVFSADFDGDFDLYVLDPYSNEKPIRLFNTLDDELSPTFQPIPTGR